MSTQTLELQAGTLEAARQDLQKKLTPGIIVIRETVINDGLSKTVEAEGVTVEDAVQTAVLKLPAQATIEQQDVVRQPIRETVQVLGFDESEARQQLGVSWPKRIESISVTEPGRKGFLGIGRRPNKYDLLITQPTLVRITYREPARIRAEVRAPFVGPWYVLPKGQRKEGPYTLEQLRAVMPMAGMRIKPEGDSEWVALQNAREFYPELTEVDCQLLDEKPRDSSPQPKKVESAFEFDTDDDIVTVLTELCEAYAADDRGAIKRLEPIATRIGRKLDKRGGIGEMRRIFRLVPDMRGKRTLDMHWGGIGDWLG